MVKGLNTKDHIGRVGRGIKMLFSRMIPRSIKVLVLYALNINLRISQLLTLVMETSAKTLGLAGS